VLFPLLAIRFTYAEVPQSDRRAENPVDTSTPFFEKRFAGWPGEITRTGWEARRAQLQIQILTAAGLYPLPVKRPVPRAERFGKKEYDGFSVEKVWIETSRNYWLGANLYRPLTPGRHPAILSPHGHWKDGRAEQTDTGNVPARAVMLARMGFVVLNYDMVGYNDTRQTPHAFGSAAEQLWNWGPMGLQLWNSIRATDFVQSLPEVDPDRLGATGASGGGTQTFLLTAVDDRIRWSAPVNMISGVMQGGSPCENAPGLRIDTFNVEIGALSAPRPMLMVAAAGDWTRNTPKDEYPAVRRIYALYGKESEVESVQFNAPHNYNQASREAVYDFFARKVLGLPKGPKESNIPVFVKGDLLILDERPLPSGAYGYERILEQFKATRARSPLRQRLMAALHAEWPAAVEAEVTATSFALTRPGKGDRVAGRLVAGEGAPIVVLHPRGADAAAADRRVKELMDKGRRLLILEPYRAPAVPPNLRNYLTFQRSAAAEQAQDILTLLRWLEAKGETPRLLGLEEASVWAQIGAAMSPRQVRPGKLPKTDEEWLKAFPAPGIRWALR
jgi:dienelactone hydrolase